MFFLVIRRIIRAFCICDCSLCLLLIQTEQQMQKTEKDFIEIWKLVEINSIHEKVQSCSSKRESMILSAESEANEKENFERQFSEKACGLLDSKEGFLWKIKLSSILGMGVKKSDEYESLLEVEKELAQEQRLNQSVDGSSTIDEQLRVCLESRKSSPSFRNQKISWMIEEVRRETKAITERRQLLRENRQKLSQEMKEHSTNGKYAPQRLHCRILPQCFIIVIISD